MHDPLVLGTFISFYKLTVITDSFDSYGIQERGKLRLLLSGPGGTPEDTNDSVLDGLYGWATSGSQHS